MEQQAEAPRKARIGRNPHTGEPLDIPASRAPTPMRRDNSPDSPGFAARAAGADGLCTYSYAATTDTGSSWSDFSQVDLVVAIRPPHPRLHSPKPATKLVNAWIAGVPAVLKAAAEAGACSAGYTMLRTNGAWISWTTSIRSSSHSTCRVFSNQLWSCSSE